MRFTKAEILSIYRDAVELLNQQGGCIATLHPDYSGRGMYGEVTPAISLDGNRSGVLVGAAIMAIVCERDSTEPDDLYDDLCDSGVLPTRSDSLGLGMIYY